jgi:hypothetical protein
MSYKKSIICCICGRVAEFYFINKNKEKEYLCESCAYINEEIRRLK